MKLSLLLTAALGLIESAQGMRRFPKSVLGEARTVRATSSGTRYRSYQFRPTNTTFDFKTEVGLFYRTIPFVRTMLYNQTNDATPKFAYRVGVVRLAELVGSDNALNATNTLDLNSTDAGSRTISAPNDRTVDGVVIKSLQADFTAATGTLPRTTARITAEIPLGNVTEGGVAKKHDEIKWDLSINNVKYEATGDSKLAIVLSINSPESKALITADDGTITGVRIGDGNGTFSWNSTILVNNVAKNLLVTDLGASTNLTQTDVDSGTITNETPHFLQFVIDEVKPQNIFWDPTNEIEEDAALDNSAASALMMSFGVIAAAVITLLA